MQPIPKNEFARLVPVSSSTLLLWLREHRANLRKLGQEDKANCLNYLSCLYLCDKKIIDPKEIYPTATAGEIEKAYQIITKKLEK